MRRRTGSSFSLLGEPVLVGAITILVAAVGVMLSYNANRGLPFVPTYSVNVRVPDAAELVPGNDVRIGGPGRGADINQAVANLAPLARDVRPVFHDLASPAADLRGFLHGANAAAWAIAPVAGPLALLFDAGATTSAAVAAEHAAVEAT